MLVNLFANWLCATFVLEVGLAIAWPILDPTSKAWVASCARPRNHK